MEFGCYCSVACLFTREGTCLCKSGLPHAQNLGERESNSSFLCSKESHMGCKCRAGSSVGLAGRRVLAVHQEFSAFTPHDLSYDFNSPQWETSTDTRML